MPIAVRLSQRAAPHARGVDVPVQTSMCADGRAYGGGHRQKGCRRHVDRESFVPTLSPGARGRAWHAHDNQFRFSS